MLFLVSKLVTGFASTGVLVEPHRDGEVATRRLVLAHEHRLQAEQAARAPEQRRRGDTSARLHLAMAAASSRCTCLESACAWGRAGGPRRKRARGRGWRGEAGGCAAGGGASRAAPRARRELGAQRGAGGAPPRPRAGASARMRARGLSLKRRSERSERIANQSRISASRKEVRRRRILTRKRKNVTRQHATLARQLPICMLTLLPTANRCTHSVPAAALTRHAGAL
jgi:hypothetical protein